ncbi:MAG: DUF4194 domain-containing protein [Candidatus Azotimanducaceae bacterium WSBS_2022_MAG_OTU7]
MTTNFESGDASETTPEVDPEPQQTDMPHEARRVLVQLMRQGVILAAQKPGLFESMCRHETPIRKHLAEIYLRLMLDRKTGVAFIANLEANDSKDADIDEEDVEDFATVITKRTLTLYDTLLLLVLRKHYQDRETAGEQKITIDVERIESYMTPFLPLTNHEAADQRKLKAAIQRYSSKKLLSAVRGSEDRYEITPIIRYVVSAEFLETLLEEYQTLAATATGEQIVANQPENAKDDPHG